MNNDRGRLNYGVGLDNSQLRVGVAESRRLLQGIGKTAVDEGARIDDSLLLSTGLLRKQICASIM